MKYKLDDICLKITDGSHYSPKAIEKGYPMFSVKDMTEYGFNYSNCKHISENDFEKMKKSGCVPQKDDILVAKDGSYLKHIFIYEKEKDEAILSSIAIFRPNRNLVIPKYLCYLLKSPQIFNYIANNCVSGSALPRIILKDFKIVKVDIPAIPIQNKVISILSVIDNRIKLNNRINNNLQQQVSLIYQTWFENFSLSDGICPKSWQYKTLSDIANVLSGKRPSMKSVTQTTDTSIPLVGASSIMGFTNVANHTDKILIIGRVGTLGVVQRFNTPCWTSDNTLVITSKYYEFTNQILQRINYSSLNRGSTQPLITQGDINKVITLVPDDNILAKFETIAGTLIAQYKTNIIKNKKLSEIHDVLLSKLMSGKIDVSNIEL